MKKTNPDAWPEEKVAAIKGAYYEFLKHCWVKSKEKGWIVLGDNLLGSQKFAIEEIFSGLGEGIHDFKILKSRQLGISTVIRALMAFWTGAFEVTASLVFDTSQHLQEARQELVDIVERFPESFEFPRIVSNNRYSLTLNNRSRINFSAAGVTETKSSGTLGRGSAVSVAHRSELCSYQNVSGLEAWRSSLARVNPDRLFVDESTARGFNIWNEIWEDAKRDHHCKCIFIGWWLHDLQRINRDHPDFDIYGTAAPTEEEENRIKEVWERYGFKIDPEQLAWIRREMNPANDNEEDIDENRSGDPLRIQEQPWTEDDAWQMTGSVFFQPTVLIEQAHKNSSKKYTGYEYSSGSEFTELRIYRSTNRRSVQLKVWHEPVEQSVYIVAVDVAFGLNEMNDRSCIQVLRCFSDGIDQVAEYAWPLVNTRQLAWIVASIEGWYAGESSEIYRILDINGPGEAVWRELLTLRQQLSQRYFGNKLEEKGLQNIQKNVRNYLYTRSDSMNSGNVFQFKANTQLKIAIMERMNDFTSNGMLRIRSMDTLEEMRTITREGDSIAAQGRAKDDRVMSLAMGVRCWDESVRRKLIAARRTRQTEEAKRRLSLSDQIAMFNQNQFEGFLAGKSVARRRALIAARRAGWR